MELTYGSKKKGYRMKINIQIYSVTPVKFEYGVS